mgnify:CR=1 FL=1
MTTKTGHPPQTALLQEAITAALAGDKAAARTLLEQITAAHPENELAWLWLASVSITPPDIMRCWRHVLKINPQQEQAILGLKHLLLQEGVAAAKSGHKEEARELLLELTALDQTHEVAWLWLATLARNVEEATRHTLHVLRINPNNERAKAWIEKLQPSSPQPAPIAPPPAATPVTEASLKILSSSTWSCPFCQTEALRAPIQCTYCHAVVSLINLDEVIDNKEVKLQLIQSAVRRFAAQVEAAGDKADYTLLFNLGLGYLNLGQFDEGAAYLRRASELKLKDVRLKAQVEALLQRVSESAAASDAAVTAASLATTASTAEAKGHTTEPSGSYTILMVDDSPTIRKLVSMTLEKYGHQVICATNGLDALNKLKEVVPDLILSDITMPHMDGYQLCKMIRGNAVTKGVPIIMLSGKDGIFDKLRGRMVGATAYITKPFEIDSLLQLIDMHCQESAQRI